MSCRPVTAWLFGKLPSHGDFVTRGLSPAERDQLDRWLSDEMEQARDMLGEQFAARFDETPPVLFAHPCEAGWEGGALCPSIDSAGTGVLSMTACSRSLSRSARFQLLSIMPSRLNSAIV